jgi:hypothetical protein
MLSGDGAGYFLHHIQFDFHPIAIMKEEAEGKPRRVNLFGILAGECVDPEAIRAGLMRFEAVNGTAGYVVGLAARV